MMTKNTNWNSVKLIVGVMTLVFLTTGSAFGHCDTMDGPVVKDAQAALEAGDVTGVLKWVPEESEDEIREVFEKSLAVRTKGPEARELADMYFFETLVRVHRASEGAPYTGIKLAGTPIPAPITKSDEALATGNVDDLSKRIASAVESGIRERFAVAVETKKHKEQNPQMGRAFVAAYVEFVHYVERIHDTAVGHGVPHSHE